MTVLKEDNDERLKQSEEKAERGIEETKKHFEERLKECQERLKEKDSEISYLRLRLDNQSMKIPEDIAPKLSPEELEECKSSLIENPLTIQKKI